jgi:uncharacterized protein
MVVIAGLSRNPVWRALLLGVLAALFTGLCAAQGVLPVPQLTARVIDQTGTLDATQQKSLEDKLAAFEQQKGTQIVMLLVPTTQPEDISSFANRISNSWKIGRREVGDGVLVIVAKNDRRVRIEVAKTLEGALPDLAVRQVIDEAITPRFRQNDFAGGLHAAADQLMARITGEKLPEPAQARGGPPAMGFQWFDLAIFLFFAVPIAGTMMRRMFGRKLGALVTGGGVGAIAALVTSSLVVAGVAGLLALVFSLVTGGSAFGGARVRGRRGHYGAPIILPGGFGGGGGWGGGGGGFGGGGFSSGGGGDFGGGGASGDW